MQKRNIFQSLDRYVDDNLSFIIYITWLHALAMTFDATKVYHMIHIQLVWLFHDHIFSTSLSNPQFDIRITLLKLYIIGNVDL